MLDFWDTTPDLFTAPNEEMISIFYFARNYPLLRWAYAVQVITVAMCHIWIYTRRSVFHTVAVDLELDQLECEFTWIIKMGAFEAYEIRIFLNFHYK